MGAVRSRLTLRAMLACAWLAVGVPACVPTHVALERPGFAAGAALHALHTREPRTGQPARSRARASATRRQAGAKPAAWQAQARASRPTGTSERWVRIERRYLRNSVVRC